MTVQNENEYPSFYTNDCLAELLRDFSASRPDLGLLHDNVESDLRTRRTLKSARSFAGLASGYFLRDYLRAYGEQSRCIDAYPIPNRSKSLSFEYIRHQSDGVHIHLRSDHSTFVTFSDVVQAEDLVTVFLCHTGHDRRKIQRAFHPRRIAKIIYALREFNPAASQYGLCIIMSPDTLSAPNTPRIHKLKMRGAHLIEFPVPTDEWIACAEQFTVR